MKVSVNSWHYRFVNWAYDDVPESLCTYFWKLVLAFIVTSLGAALIEGFKQSDERRFIILTALAGLSIPLFISAYLTGFYGMVNVVGEEDYHIYTENVPYAFTIGFVFYFVCICNMINFAVSMMFMGAMLWDNYRSAHPKIRAPKGEGEGNIVVEFIKAKKNKYCPRLEFVQDG